MVLWPMHNVYNMRSQSLARQVFFEIRKRTLNTFRNALNLNDLSCYGKRLLNRCYLMLSHMCKVLNAILWYFFSGNLICTVVRIRLTVVENVNLFFDSEYWSKRNKLQKNHFRCAKASYDFFFVENAYLLKILYCIMANDLIN